MKCKLCGEQRKSLGSHECSSLPPKSYGHTYARVSGSVAKIKPLPSWAHSVWPNSEVGMTELDSGQTVIIDAATVFDRWAIVLATLKDDNWPVEKPWLYIDVMCENCHESFLTAWHREQPADSLICLNYVMWYETHGGHNVTETRRYEDA